MRFAEYLSSFTSAEIEAGLSAGDFPAIVTRPIDTSPVHARALLALDLGNYTGYAVRRRDGTIIHGTENFSPRKSWTPGQRWFRYRSWLSALIEREQIHVVTFERVVFGHSSASASDAYGGFKALTEMVADAHHCDLSSVAVPTIKKHWTGSGRAKKPDMIAEARRRGFRPDSDNAADALAILHWAIDQEGE
ncbi:crossover junction endodeoxyribonuclease RuvC [Castellaniella caeni]|uniref:crossover junction endodeoxyribonuclease RuvC n=1 Tax=Castellaniella caeni TaxID=266123 RepID=UPI000C9F4B9A|nr:hypothetical protein [Castellaniella caeni]